MFPKLLNLYLYETLYFQIEEKIDKFMQSNEEKYKFETMDRVERSIV